MIRDFPCHGIRLLSFSITLIRDDIDNTGTQSVSCILNCRANDLIIQQRTFHLVLSSQLYPSLNKTV